MVRRQSSVRTMPTRAKQLRGLDMGRHQDNEIPRKQTARPKCSLEAGGKLEADGTHPEESSSRQILAGLGFLGDGLMITAFVTLQVKLAIEQSAMELTNAGCDEVALKIQQRIDAHAPIFRGEGFSEYTLYPSGERQI
jgi:hypothetical protein